MPNKSKASSQEKDVLTSIKKKEKRDYFLLALPWKSASMKMKIANKIIALLRQQPLLREKDIILKLISEDQEIKQYYIKTQSVSVIRYVIWYLSKRRVIYKAKVLGDDKHVFYFLPDQLDQIKSSILLYPSDFNPSVLKYYSTGNSKNTNTNTSASTRGEEEEEEEEEDEWLEECLESEEDC